MGKKEEVRRPEGQPEKRGMKSSRLQARRKIDRSASFSLASALAGGGGGQRPPSERGGEKKKRNFKKNFKPSGKSTGEGGGFLCAECVIERDWEEGKDLDHQTGANVEGRGGKGGKGALFVRFISNADSKSIEGGTGLRSHDYVLDGEGGRKGGGEERQPRFSLALLGRFQEGGGGTAQSPTSFQILTS